MERLRPIALLVLVAVAACALYLALTDRGPVPTAPPPAPPTQTPSSPVIGVVPTPTTLEDRESIVAPVPSAAPWTVATSLSLPPGVKLGMSGDALTARFIGLERVETSEGRLWRLVDDEPPFDDIDRVTYEFDLQPPHGLQRVELELGRALRGEAAFERLIGEPGLARGSVEMYQEPRFRKAMWHAPDWRSVLELERETGAVRWRFIAEPARHGTDDLPPGLGPDGE